MKFILGKIETCDTNRNQIRRLEGFRSNIEKLMGKITQTLFYLHSERAINMYRK